MNSAEQFIQDRLRERADNGSLRKLSISHAPIDFCSNDYLGFARSAELRAAIENTLKNTAQLHNGSGGSRLLTGNAEFTEETEAYIADFHQAEAGLLFNSGYDANIGLLSCVAQRGDTIITDELIHASLIDGARLSLANRYTFKHNDLESLEAKLKASKGCIYVIIESVYSMDGDIAPLIQISNLCKLYNANLIVDEAHALGVFGEHGKGLVQQEQIQHDVFARIVTFGKALGCHGAIVLGSWALRQYLINFARSFIYTTAAPPTAIIAIKCAYQMLAETDHATMIRKKINHYASLLASTQNANLKATQSAIQTISCPGNDAARRLAKHLQTVGIDVRAILSPTVKTGQERLRICLHTYNTNMEISLLTDTLANLK